MAPVTEFLVPASLRDAMAGRYEIERELGRGGMATVYLALDLKHDRLVALKVLHPELALALGPERFLREIRLTAQLQHPDILPVFDSGRAPAPAGDGGLLYYTMPYVRGESLRQRLERERQLRLDDALRIARRVLAALGHAHAQGIVHRDIKPENILLYGNPSHDRSATGDDQAMVADFGIGAAPVLLANPFPRRPFHRRRASGNEDLQREGRRGVPHTFPSPAY